MTPSFLLIKSIHKDTVKVLKPTSTLYQISEAESAYVFSGSSLTPVFKRWSREVSPPELYNHGFENMESMGKMLHATETMMERSRDETRGEEK